MPRLSVYDTALMLAGQFNFVHFHSKRVKRGTILVVVEGPEDGVYINPADAPPCTPTLNLGPAKPAKKQAAHAG